MTKQYEQTAKYPVFEATNTKTGEETYFRAELEYVPYMRARVLVRRPHRANRYKTVLMKGDALLQARADVWKWKKLKDENETSWSVYIIDDGLVKRVKPAEYSNHYKKTIYEIDESEGAYKLKSAEAVFNFMDKYSPFIATARCWDEEEDWYEEQPRQLIMPFGKVRLLKSKNDKGLGKWRNYYKDYEGRIYLIENDEIQEVEYVSEEYPRAVVAKEDSETLLGITYFSNRQARRAIELCTNRTGVQKRYGLLDEYHWYQYKKSKQKNG